MTAQEESQSATRERTEQHEPTAREKAEGKEKENEDAAEEMHQFEQGEPPTDLNDWPTGPAQYLTYGNDDESYGSGVTEKLGPAALERFSDGSIKIAGKEVDNPEDYKGEPLAGGPTDPDAANR